MPAKGRSVPTYPNRGLTGLSMVMLLSAVLSPCLFAASIGPLHAGWIEKARVFPGDWEFTAKLDTGADNSSLHCQDQQFYTHAGARWVRCTITDDLGRTETLEREVVRMARIKRHARNSEVRPVVLLGICVGDVYRETEVNLTDRSRFRYLLLIGRKFMRGRIVVDPALRFTHTPHCGKKKP